MHHTPSGPPSTARFAAVPNRAARALGRRHWILQAILVPAAHAAEFATLTPHAVTAHDGPVEILTILDPDGRRAHLAPVGLST